VERWLLVMAGGALGSLARYLTGMAISVRYPGRFPLGTFIVNVAGSLAIGIVMTMLATRLAHTNWRLFLVVGFLGGFTTFSTFAFETWMTARTQPLLSFWYVVGSVGAGYLGVWLGVWLAGGHK
jgi:CrcB protein